MSAVIHEPHPILDYGLIYLAQKLGITDVGALRALNFLGVLGVAAALFAARRRQSILTSEACVVITLYASSTVFLLSFAEVRAYFLLFSASLAATLVWKIVLDGTASPAQRRGDWIWLFVSLIILVNLHYFGTLFGGFLTLSLIVDAAWRRDWRRAGILALTGALAAAPAVLLFYIQSRVILQPEVNAWLQTSFTLAIKFLGVVAGMTLRMNYVAMAAAAMGALFLIESWRRIHDARWILWLAATFVAFVAFVLFANSLRPFVGVRYFYAASGAMIVLAAALASRPYLPRLTVVAVCAAAILAQCYGIFKPGETDDGWRPSAAAIARQIEQCPTTHVYAVPWSTPAMPASTSTPWMMFGYKYYADRYHFAYQQLPEGSALTSARDPCPSLIWVEHAFPFRAPNASADQVLQALHIKADGAADLQWIGSGAIIIVH